MGIGVFSSSVGRALLRSLIHAAREQMVEIPPAVVDQWAMWIKLLMEARLSRDKDTIEETLFLIPLDDDLRDLLRDLLLP